PALALLDEAVDVARQGAQTLTGMLRVTAPVPLGVRYLAPVITAFRERHPRLGFDLQLSDHVVDLYGGDIDLAVRVGQLADSRLVSRKLADSQRILVAAPTYLRGMGAPMQDKTFTSSSRSSLRFRHKMPTTRHPRKPFIGWKIKFRSS
ncbi:LysR substrate-binding domain-containing protein, partial [Azotobacter chroococcum]|nr:LysR substrate-binding domain-containing protein [Azotobacter chroococcum]